MIPPFITVLIKDNKMFIKDFLINDAKLIKGDENISVKSLAIDSRKCTQGSMYFAIDGTQVDGHKFVDSAYKNGAVCAVVEREVDCPIPQILVKNTRLQMSYMASLFYGNPSKKLKMLGVTGTNGKTSISYMVKAIAKANNISCGVIGTGGIWLNDEKLDIKILTATTPDPIELQYALSEMVKKGAKWVVMEVTAHALDLYKVNGINFVSAGFTNLTQDHLEYFITMENYALAKAKFFEKNLSQNGIINIDDEFGNTLLNKEIPCLTYSYKEKADLFAKNVKIEATYSTFDLEYNNETYNVRTNTTGLFNISNVLCAIGCALKAGLDIKDCIKGISAFSSVPGRFESVDTNGREITVIVDYAHTPDGLENILAAINTFKKGRLICVFGCGGNRDTAKRAIMGEIAGRLSDYCVLTSDNPRFEEPEAIIDQIEQGIKKTSCPYVRNADRFSAIKHALEYAKKGDVIAICGKGDEDYQEILGVKHHFSDREAVEEIVC